MSRGSGFRPPALLGLRDRSQTLVRGPVGPSIEVPDSVLSTFNWDMKLRDRSQTLVRGPVRPSIEVPDSVM